MLTSNEKRKGHPSQHPELSFRKKRRVAAQDARIISAQTSAKAIEGGEIDVDAFVKARKFEISALQDAMKRSKKTLNTRAFQNVPRGLRRRTASHTPSRVPKRLRARALKEMILDNTPINKAKLRTPSTRTRLRFQGVKRSKTLQSAKSNPEQVGQNSNSHASSTKSAFRTSGLKKNRLLKPPLPRAKFRKRQIHKTWLPTHLFHAKRAHMPPPNEPLWRMAIPLSPTAKSYRPIHRAAHTRGAVAWDVSYISTIAIEGSEPDILATLQRFGVGWTESFNFTDRESARWIAGSRFKHTWLYKPGTNLKESIAPVDIGWTATPSLDKNNSLKDQNDMQDTMRMPNISKPQRRKVFVRIHPSAFLEFWELLLAECKAQPARLTVTDLRFEIGSLNLVGPASTEALAALLQCSGLAEADSSDLSNFATLWRSLSDLNDPALLPANSIICMEVTDPRLRASPPHQPKSPINSQTLLQTLSDWPLDKHPLGTRLFDTTSRIRACRMMPSQKSINRRRTLTTHQAAIDPLVTDPRIPVVLMASRKGPTGKSGWTILLPWKCLRVFWYSLMYGPLSAGNSVLFAGLNEERQLAFEAGSPWFPADFPGTKAGMAWEQLEEIKRKAEWETKPKGKRIEWDSISLGKGRKGEVGAGWSCDWKSIRRIEGQQPGEENAEQTPFERISPSLALSLLRKLSGEKDERVNGLIEVKLDMISQGVPKTCARIYRLPTDDPESRVRWISLQASGNRKSRSQFVQVKKQDKAPRRVRQQQLAAKLLEPDTTTHGGQEYHPAIPGEIDLIGFVTTGNFNLREGKGVGIGSILLRKVLPVLKETSMSSRRADSEAYLCIVREAGHTIGRLAKWKLASSVD